MSPDDADAMNLRAYMALEGATVDWRTDLACLLRSNVPLDRVVRDRLVELVENVSGTGPSLELTGHKAARDRFAGVVSRHEWMKIGRWVAAYDDHAGVGVGAAQAAAVHFGQGIKKVEAAVTYFNKVTVWTDRAMESDAGKVMGRDWVERIYHAMVVHPDMKHLNEDLLRQLSLSH